MKTQTIINCVFAIAFIALAVIVVAPRDATFDTITCKGWSVVDADGEKRITAYAKFDWADVTLGVASVDWFDKGGQLRITAGIIDDGYAGVVWKDKYGRSRIHAATHAEGTVELPTEDFDPPKKP